MIESPFVKTDRAIQEIWRLIPRDSYIGVRTWVDYLLSLGLGYSVIRDHSVNGRRYLTELIDSLGFDPSDIKILRDKNDKDIFEFTSLVRKVGDVDIVLIYRNCSCGDIKGIVKAVNLGSGQCFSPIGSCEPSSSFKQAFLITGEEGNRSLQTFQI